MWLLDIGITFGPIIGYYSQYSLIKKQKSLGTFSIYVCAILLIANILRVYFWLTTGFAFNLLVQSLFVIAFQLILLKECVQLSNYEPNENEIWKSFWKWATFEEYLKFLLMLTAIMTVVTLVFQIFTFGYYGQMVGMASLTIESFLGFPQLFANYQKRSTKGLSYMMIMTWFVGDFFKTIYYVIELQPFQFIMCGIVQLTVDILIVLQIMFYEKEKEYDKVDAANQ